MQQITKHHFWSYEGYVYAVPGTLVDAAPLVPAAITGTRASKDLLSSLKGLALLY